MAVGADLLSAIPTPEGIVLRWRGRGDGDECLEECFSWLWLRDHSPDPQSLNPATFQREVDVFSAPPSPPEKVNLYPDKTRLTLTWQDGTVSEYSAAFLYEMATNKRTMTAGPLPQLWADRATCQPWPAFSYAEVVSADAALGALLMAIARLGFGCVTDCPSTEAGTRTVLERIGYIRHSLFGGLWTFGNSMEHSDSAYGCGFLEPHTDGTYCFDAPGLQTLHCLSHDGEGGETLLVDGFALADTLRDDDPEAFTILTQIEVPAHYRDASVFLRAQRPVIRLDAEGRLQQISFNNADRSPFWLGRTYMERFYRAYGHFHALANEATRQIRFHLEPGCVLIVDNWRVLHGRTAFTGQRTMCGCYHNREDFESRLRMLGLDRSTEGTDRRMRREAEL